MVSHTTATVMKTSRDANGNVTEYTYDGYDRLVKVMDPLNNETVIGRAEFGNLSSKEVL